MKPPPARPPDERRGDCSGFIRVSTSLYLVAIGVAFHFLHTMKSIVHRSQDLGFATKQEIPLLSESKSNYHVRQRVCPCIRGT
jgi:hypothetical protein